MASAFGWLHRNIIKQLCESTRATKSSVKRRWNISTHSSSEELCSPWMYHSDSWWFGTLQWRHNGRDSVSNHQSHDCFLNRLFRCRSKENIKAPLAFVRGIHRGPVNSPHKWPVTRKMFPLDDVIIPLFVRITSLILRLPWDCHVITFTKKVHPRLAKPPLKFNGGLAKLELTSLVKATTSVPKATLASKGSWHMNKERPVHRFNLNKII